MVGIILKVTFVDISLWCNLSPFTVHLVVFNPTLVYKSVCTDADPFTFSFVCTNQTLSKVPYTLLLIVDKFQLPLSESCWLFSIVKFSQTSPDESDRLNQSA